MNRTLARLLKRSAGIGSEAALARILDEALSAAPGLPVSADLKTLIARLPAFLERVDATFDQFDRDLDLRTRSLELTSEELVGANERLVEDLALRNRVLDALREAAATLLSTSDAATSIPETSDVEGLSALLPALVRQQEANRAALAASERKFATLYRNTPVLLHATDASGLLTSVNDYWLSQLGYTRDEAIGRRLTEFMTDASRDHVVGEVMPLLRRTGFCTDVAIQLVKKDGTPMDVVLSAHSEKAADGSAVVTMVAMVDVTEQRKAQRLQGALHEIAGAGSCSSTK